ncbi:MAG: S-adenosylmethionine:tRNA ribosyltransferase-isomerase [Bacteroides sp.]|nr:S-adenosylmethionine:tRNA ribosyltransferase-isomerase [Bacteroides sp.]MDD2644880.1 S-adenosylmethionine:tRNA ribosyltransferase-isomerase [Bacteroides sp.]MDD4055666.1 S-adenosylmethionine:tRNA ribosyltransferase-isomerase [Bacteroides sp.]MDD4719906.1 S-adenosylmethionine:tRNA ribosyltransferase-isomerase [Bacteroides sp.]
MKNKPQQIQIKDYNYQLPEERIAKFPLPVRDESKLLIYKQGQITEDRFHNLANFLPKDSLMIFNNTKVIQARLRLQKETGATIEIFCLEPASPTDYNLNFQSKEEVSWYCMIGNLKKWKEGTLKQSLVLKGEKVTLSATRGEAHETGHRVNFHWDNSNFTFTDILEAFGELPIPPYLNRKTEETDKVTYQTVYSKIKGSVAAPTAGLHFTPRVLDSIRKSEIAIEEITLHVGAGTFRPVKSDEIGKHEMHTEYFTVRREVIEKLIQYKGQAIAVGTTSVRTLESLYHIGVFLQDHPNASEEELAINQWQAYEQQHKLTALESLHNILTYLTVHQLDRLNTHTRIIIAPGYEYQLVKAMITNFHQPQSTLLLLVSAFVKEDNWKDIYDFALNHNFRFLSYGDSSLLIP